MLLFDIGAVIFGAGLLMLIYFIIRKDKNHKAKLLSIIFSIIMECVGGIFMFIAYYVVADNTSVFTKILM